MSSTSNAAIMYFQKFARKLGALLGPLAWDKVSQEESRYRTEVGKPHSSMPEMLKGTYWCPFFAPVMAQRQDRRITKNKRCNFLVLTTSNTCRETLTVRVARWSL